MSQMYDSSSLQLTDGGESLPYLNVKSKRATVGVESLSIAHAWSKFFGDS